MLSNLFRKNKIYRYHPRNTWSGTGVAVKDFCEYKDYLEKATGHLVNLVATKNILGYSFIIYEIGEEITTLRWIEEEKPIKAMSTRELLMQSYKEKK